MNKGTGNLIGWGIAIIIVIALISIIIPILGIVALVATIYYIVQLSKDSQNKKYITTHRLIPAIVIMLVCGGLTGAIYGNDADDSGNQNASSKVEHHKKAKSESKKAKSSSDDSESDIDSDNDDSEDNDSSLSSDSEQDSNGDATDDDTGIGSNNHGDMVTDQQGTIVGNARTMIYHTPDQHGYRMNSSNAVYFNSEAEAQAAGYRKALR